MEDISEKLAALLGDESGMEKIKELAQNLLSGSAASQEPIQPEEPEPDLNAIMGLVRKMKSSGADDSKIALLKALKPNLSDERQPKVDNAIKILRLLELAPLLKDMGLFN